MTPPEVAAGEAGSHQASSVKMTMGIVLCGLGVGGAFVALGAAFITSARSAKRDGRTT